MRKALCTLLSVICLCAFGAAVAQGQAVKRAQPPKFDSSVTSGIFFNDIFTEGFVGPRPPDLGRVPAQIVGNTPGTTGTPSTGGNTPSGGGGGVFAWSKIISPTTVEDEVKAVKLKVDEEITTPTDFAGKGYKAARRNFTTLAVLFAITGEYDGSVRWKDDATAARDTFARTAANCKVGTIQVYNEAKQRKDELQDLIGGAKLQSKGGEAKANWAQVCDRSPIMQRLEMGFQNKLQPWLGSQNDFKSNNEQVLHEAEILAALGEVLKKEGMVDADDAEYAKFCDELKKGALQVVDAVKQNNYDQARQAAGVISQSCAKCHENYR
jgi:hypothetical protein